MTARFITHEQARRFYDRIGRGQDARPISERRALDALAARGDFARRRGRDRVRLRHRAVRRPAAARTRCRAARPTSASTSARTWWSSRARPWRRGPAAPASSFTDGSVHFPVPDASCDRVVGTYVLDLLSPADAAAFVAEARRVLRPGGLLALASLAPGRAASTRLVTRLWQAVWNLNPALLGGCRPLQLRTLLDPARTGIRWPDPPSPTGS